MSVDTGYRPHTFQAEIHKNLKRFSVLVCHRRFGKTYLAVNTLIDAALRTKKSDARFAYVAPFRNQAKSIAWDYVKRFSAPVPGRTVNEGELWIGFPTGARVRLFGADNADAMRGLYFDGVVMDEVADMRPEVWGEIIRPALADRKGWALFIGTPKGLNLFHELYERACRTKSWYAGLFRADETGLIDEGELIAAQEAMTEMQYRQEFLCDFQASCDNVLIPIDLATRATRREVTEKDVYGLPRIIGVDVARFGDDRSVIQRRQGLVAFPPVVLREVDNMTLAGHVAKTIAEWDPDAVFIDAGRGEGVIDRLRQLGHDVIEVNFGGRPITNTYANKRAEMWDGVRIWLNAGGNLPDDNELKRDLAAPTYSFDAAGRMVLESKDKIKARGLSSPDLADALALTFAHPVAPRSLHGDASFAQADYKPFG